MKNIGIVSYNLYSNFTNYGSALQSWALHRVVRSLGYSPVLVDYCPDILMDKDPLNPFKNMWDKDEESKRMCELSMPSIRENYQKFDNFYSNSFYRSRKKYTSKNFNEIIKDEYLSGFICGSDTIFCMDEFGFDDGFFANFDCMKKHSVSYAASFGDPTLNEENCFILNQRLQNFLSLGLREKNMIPYVKEQVSVQVQKVLDPTLLLSPKDFDCIATPNRLVEDKYLLYYSRRYSPAMESYVEKMAKENDWKIVEISLRATNKEKGHIMYYQAGVEEFLSLIKNAEYVVTNSYHGMILSVQYRRPFVIFSREQCNTKIKELLDFLGLNDRIRISGFENDNLQIDFRKTHDIIESERINSLEFLREELKLL